MRCGHLNQRKFRYIAFRQLVRWFWGYLGKHVRVAQPSCAVNKIRSTFLAEFGTSNTGLKPPSLWEKQRCMSMQIIIIHVLQHWRLGLNVRRHFCIAFLHPWSTIIDKHVVTCRFPSVKLSNPVCVCFDRKIVLQAELIILWVIFKVKISS